MSRQEIIDNPVELLILILAIFVVLAGFSIIGTPTGEATAQQDYNGVEGVALFDMLLSVNDGYFEDDREAVRAVDFTVASSEVPAETEVEAQLILANYGSETEEDIELEPSIVDTDTGSEMDGDGEDYSVSPQEEYEISLEPGEHKVYDFEFTLSDSMVGSDYNIRFVDESIPEERPVAEETVTVRPEGSGATGSLLIDRDRVTMDKIPVTRYKDENVDRETGHGASSSIPPVDTEDGSIVDVDVAEGDIVSFSNIRGDTSSAGTIESSTGEINVGFSAENIPSEDHYAISTVYGFDGVDSIELDVVTSTGEEVDENTSYTLSSPDGDRDEAVFQLSGEEANYIDSNGEVFLEYSDADTTTSDVEISMYEKQIIALNEVWNLPESDLSADVSVEPDEAEIGERVDVEAVLTNDGNMAETDEFRLFETNIGADNATVTSSDQTIVNPGDEKTIEFSVPVTNEGLHEFRVLDDYADVEVAEEGEGAIRATIQNDADVVGEGDSVGFEVGGVDADQMERVEEFNWNIEGEDGDGSGEEFSHTFEQADMYTVSLETVYEDGEGGTETHDTQTVIEVLEEPEVEIGAVQYDFRVDEHELRGNSVGSSASGTMAAGTCEEMCGADFSFDGIDLAVTEGINMMVFEVDRDGHQYEPVYYGAYNVNEGYFAVTEDVTSDGMSAISNGLSNEEDHGSHAATELASDIEDYSDDDHYFLFTSGGNPAPSEYEDELIDELTGLGADLSDTDGASELEEDAMWTFAVQTPEGGDAVPLHESYLPSESDEPMLEHEYDIQPVDVSDSATAAPERPVHYDIDSTRLGGSLSDADIDWVLDDGSLESDELYVTEFYDSVSDEHEIEVTVEDNLGLEGTAESIIETGTEDPTADIFDEITAEIEEETSIYGPDSYDIDSTIDSYEWSIEDGGEEEVISERTPVFEWDEPGQHTVTLEVTDRFGNTDTTTEDVQIMGAPPDVDIDTQRVLSDFGVTNKPAPAAHYTFSGLYDDEVEDIAGNNDGEIEGDITPTDGVEGAAANFDGESYIEIPSESLRPDDALTVSFWSYTGEDESGATLWAGGGWDAEGYSVWHIEDDEIRTELQNEDNHEHFDSDISTDEWTHFAVTWDETTETAITYVNGEKAETQTFEGELDEDIDKPIYLGYNDADTYDSDPSSDQEYFDGRLDDVRIYNESLMSNQVWEIYAADGLQEYNDRESVTGDVFYDFGEKYIDIEEDEDREEGDGVVSEEDDHFYIESDARTDPSSTRYISSEEVDLSQYDTVYMTYDATIDREDSDGNIESGYVRLEAGSEQETHTVYDHMNTGINGVMEVDVSNVDSTDEIRVRSRAHSSNEGKTQVEVYELWGEQGSASSHPSQEDLYEHMYPDISENTIHHETRSGIRFISTGDQGERHNIIPAGTASELEFDHSVRTDSLAGDGFNLYADESGSYTLNSGGAAPESILCMSSSELDPDCSDTGDSPDSATADGGPYSHVGLATALDNGHAVVESLRIAADNHEETGYPTVRFDGTASDAAGAGVTIEKYEWDLNGDTSFSTDHVGQEMTHTFTESGEHTIALRTTDSQGESETETFTIEVENVEPSVNPVFSTDIDLGNEVTFDSGASDNGGEDIDQVVWDFGDGEIETGDEVTYQFDSAGEYDVTVVAIDEAGLTAAETRTVNVSAQDPDLESITQSLTTHVRDTLIFDTTGDRDDGVSDSDHPPAVRQVVDVTDANDPDGGELTFDWTYPDGSTETDEEKPVYVTDIVGEKDAELTAIDSEGRTATSDIEITTINQGPELSMSVQDTGNEPEQSEADKHTYVTEEIAVEVEARHPHERIEGVITVDMGDGETYTDEVPTDAGQDYNFEFTHEFEVPSDEYDEEDFPELFEIESEIEDPYGGTDRDNRTVEVELREIDVGLDVSPNTAQIFQESITMNPVDVENPDSEISEYAFDWSDGNTTTRTTETSVQHDYNDEGTFQPELEIEDEYGQTASDASQVRVIVEFDDVIFLACGIDEGYEGPMQSQCDDSYANSDLEGWVNVDDGIQEWTVPQTGIYRVRAAGAEGGEEYGGEGAVIEMEDQLDRDEELRILSGLMGSLTSHREAGGGGGTFVATDDDEPIVVAGGGGASYSDRSNQHANLGEDGQDGAQSGGGGSDAEGGTGGDGGEEGNSGNDGAGGASGGAGFFGFGICDHSRCDEPEPFVEGGIASDMSGDGGFGGGGGGRDAFSQRAGGGGGYSGGAGARGRTFQGGHTTGGGGGSYTPSSATVTETGHYYDYSVPNAVEHTGTGYVEVELIDAPEIDIEAYEINEDGARRVLSDGDEIDEESEIELYSTYNEGLSDAPLTTTEWYLGDGTTQTGESITHEYDTETSHQITVEARGSDDTLYAYDTIDIDVGESDIEDEVIVRDGDVYLEQGSGTFTSDGERGLFEVTYDPSGEIAYGTTDGAVPLDDVEEVVVDWEHNLYSGDSQDVSYIGVHDDLDDITRRGTRDDDLNAVLRNSRYEDNDFDRRNDTVDVSDVDGMQHVGVGAQISSSSTHEMDLKVWSIKGKDSSGDTVFELDVS